MTDEHEDTEEQGYAGLPEHDPEMVMREKVAEMESHENATFRVYRQHSGHSSRMSLCFSVAADQLDFDELLEKIKKEHGGGDYRVHLRGPTDKGKNQLIANQVVSIESPKTTQPETGAQSELGTFMSRMMDRMEKLEERLANPAQPSQPAQNYDPFDMMQRMMETMGSFMGMIGKGGTPGKEKSLIEQIEEAEKIAERFGKMQQDDGGFSQLIEKGLGPLIDLAKQDAERRKEAGNGQGQSRQPNPQPRPVQPSQPSPSNGQENMNLQIMGHVRTLIAAAERNGDPETYAEIVLDFVDAEHYAQLYEFLSHDNCFDAAGQYFPKVLEHREWFESLRHAIIAQLDVDEGPGETGEHGMDHASGTPAGPGDVNGATAGAGGDPENVADDGEDGTGGEGALADPPTGDADSRSDPE